MKFLSTALAATLLVGTVASAQLRGLPRSSPKAAAVQTVGATDLRVDYSRPAVRERKIWGGLVPYDQVWRAGANETTTFETSSAIRIEGQELSAGKYGLHLVPGEKSWTFILSRVHEGWGSSGYDPNQDALRVTVEAKAAPHTEWMTFAFSGLSSDSATLSMHWDKIQVPVRIEVDTAAIVVGKIEAQLAENGSPENYLAAANYCLTQSVSYQKGLQWVDKAMASGESFNGLVVKGGLLDAMGNEVDADPLLQKALGMSPSPNQLARLGRQFLRLERHAMALRFLYPFVDASPDTGWAWKAIGDCLANLGLTEDALASYETAIGLTKDEAEIANIREASARIEKAGQ